MVLTGTSRSGYVQRRRSLLIVLDDVVADHAAVDAAPLVKPEWRTYGQLDIVLTDGEAVASWTVHQAAPELITGQMRDSWPWPMTAPLRRTQITHKSYGLGRCRMPYLRIQHASTLARPGDPSHTARTHRAEIAETGSCDRSGEWRPGDLLLQHAIARTQATYLPALSAFGTIQYGI